MIHEDAAQFGEPGSTKEAYERLDTLIWKLERIQGQLISYGDMWEGDAPVRNSTIKSAEEYYDWKHRTLKARSWKKREYRFLLRWLNKQAMQSASSGSDLKALDVRLRRLELKQVDNIHTAQ